MTAIKSIPLPARGVLGVGGPEARTFLQGLVTNDVTRVNPARAIYAALLTPQGKFLFDFLIADDGIGGLLLDTDRDRLPELAKRLTFYKLRSKVEIVDRSDDLAVTAQIGEAAARHAKLNGAAGNAWRFGDTMIMVDPRLARLGVRLIHPAGQALAIAGDETGSPEDYEALRLDLGVPEGGRDVLVDKSFILESNFEELNAIDFDKGCYVGQGIDRAHQTPGQDPKTPVPRRRHRRSATGRHTDHGRPGRNRRSALRPRPYGYRADPHRPAGRSQRKRR